jgi:hypothetical protein
LLEAELNASWKAFDVATAAKANAEKSQKLALAKAKKAEKALADASKENFSRVQPENFSQRVCIYVNMLFFYDISC